KLGNKLQLNRAVAAVDLRRAQIDLRKAEMDLLTSVRRGFFKVLVAQESIRVLRALEVMATRLHTAHAEQLVNGADVAPYQPRPPRAGARGRPRPPAGAAADARAGPPAPGPPGPGPPPAARRVEATGRRRRSARPAAHRTGRQPRGHAPADLRARHRPGPRPD